MDFLPYELQVKYLITLSCREIGRYCLTSKTTTRILSDDWFWEEKTNRDFKLSLKTFPLDETHSLKKYLSINRIWETYPVQLIKMAIRKNNQPSLICLLNRLNVTLDMIDPILEVMISSGVERMASIIVPTIAMRYIVNTKSLADLNAFAGTFFKHGLRALSKGKYVTTIIMGIYWLVLTYIIQFLSRRR